MTKNVNKSKGAVSTIALILGIVLVIVVIIIFIIVRINAAKNVNSNSSNSNNSNLPVPPAVYDSTVGPIRFVFESAVDLGSVLRPRTGTISGQNLTTTERFIQVIVGAQNKGKVNLPQGSWDVGNIVDSEGRNFVPINQQAFYYIPANNVCATLLKPEFEPVPCVKLYEVSKQSVGLKVEVITNINKKQKGFLDLIVD